MDMGGKKIEVNLQKNNPFLATEAYLCDDVVIFDGSLEDQEENTKNNAVLKRDFFTGGILFGAKVSTLDREVKQGKWETINPWRSELMKDYFIMSTID